MLFEWDENKNFINKRKHKVGFETALRVFDDPFLLTSLDTRFRYYEERWETIGLIDESLISVLHTIEAYHEEEIIRIITARKTNSSETRRYYINRGHERGITSVKSDERQRDRL